MPRRTDAPIKKPTGGRPVPRRLFSLDAFRKEKTTEVPSESSDNGRSNTVLSDETVAESPQDTFTEGAGWTEKPMVTSPVLSVEPIPRTTETPPPLDLSRITVGLGSGDAAGPPVSPSRRRWETIRTHVLPSSSSTDSLPLASPPALDNTGVPSRPSTPKLPRFGYKKNLRQVVEHYQTQQAGENKRFAEAIRVACWQTRFGDGSQPPKPEREGTLGVGSALHLPFMASSTSLVAASSSNISVTQSTKSSAMKRPQSTHTLAQARAPSVTHIARVIASTPSANRPVHLPLESLILSTLLLPFLDPRQGTRVDIEQESAVESFEYIIRTWHQVTNEVSLILHTIYVSSRKLQLRWLWNAVFGVVARQLSLLSLEYESRARSRPYSFQGIVRSEQKAQAFFKRSCKGYSRSSIAFRSHRVQTQRWSLSRVTSLPCAAAVAVNSQRRLWRSSLECVSPNQTTRQLFGMFS